MKRNASTRSNGRSFLLTALLLGHLAAPDVLTGQEAVSEDMGAEIQALINEFSVGEKEVSAVEGDTTKPIEGGGEESGEAMAMSGPDAEGENGSVSSSGMPSGNRFNFQADLFTGRFSYTVPIVVAPGRQGAQPSLALGYNSAGGNGWCGVGWALDVGFIQRETRNGVPVKWNLPSPTPLHGQFTKRF